MDTSSEEFRLKCEVNYILDLKPLWVRRAYLRNVERKRGKKHTERLKAAVEAEWSARRQRRSKPDPVL